MDLEKNSSKLNMCNTDEPDFIKDGLWSFIRHYLIQIRVILYILTIKRHNKMKKTILLLFISSFTMKTSVSVAQKMTSEKIVELTGKSKSKGYLGNVTTDDAAQKFDIVFVTKANNRKVKTETYIFDYNMNLVSNTADEQEIEKVKTKRTKQKKYNGEDVQVVEAATAERSMMGKLILKRMQTIYTYNWYTGRYEKEMRMLDKVKPTEITEEGGRERKLIYMTHQQVDSKGEVLVCALVNKGMKTMYIEPTREYVVLRVNNKVEIAEKTPLIFEHPQALLFSGAVPASDESGDDEWILVFQTYSGAGLKKLADPVPTNCTYVRIGTDGKIKERFIFSTKCNKWAIYDCFENGNDLYLYGPGLIDNPKDEYTKMPYAMTMDAIAIGLTDEQRQGNIENEKFSHMQVVKISGGKAEFVSAPSIDDINAKGIKPASQKKLREFDGKRFILNGINITSSGEVFLNGQDFRMGQAGKYRGRVYKDLFMFQFAKDGTFKRYYGIENTQETPLFNAGASVKSIPTESVIYESPNSNALVWQVFFIKGVDEDCSSSSTTYNTLTTTVTETITSCTNTPLFQGRLGKIDIANGSISDFNNFGGEDFYLYMDLGNDKGKDIPFFTINGGKQLIYLARQRKGGIKGNERWGNSIWLGKFDPATM